MPVWPCSTPPMTVRTTTTVRKTLMRPVRAWRSPGPAGAAPGKPAAEAIAYARAELGKPYLWGGTGPDAFDCSGLVMEAYASAGVPIARTSQAQWATERHVSSPQPGDLVFYPGADGTWTAPGHLAPVVGGGQMIEAYGTVYPVR